MPVTEGQTMLSSEDSKWSAWSADGDTRERATGRRRRAVLIGSGVIATALVAALALQELPARRPSPPISPYIAGVSATAFSSTSFRGGCEVWIGFLENKGSSSVKLEQAHALERDNLTVSAIALVPATPSTNGVVMVGCQHGQRYPIMPPGAKRVPFRRGALLAPKRSYAVVLDVRLPAGARLIDGSINGVRFDYVYQGWAYSVATSGGRFCTAPADPNGRPCATTPEP